MTAGEPPAPPRDVDALVAAIRAFVDARDWARFHHPKDLAIGLSVEAAELLELTLWKGAEEVAAAAAPGGPLRERVEEEVADVLVYALRLCDCLGIDPVAAITTKLRKNAAKYPAERARGRADKWTAYVDPAPAAPPGAAAPKSGPGEGVP